MAVADLTLEGLVHDLNNVFQTIAESAELLEDDPKWEKLAHTLQRSADRGHRIAHSILETNRSPSSLRLSSKMPACFARTIWNAPTGPRWNSAPEIDPDFRLKGDAAGWERVFVNLFLNSAQAGAKNIRMRARGNEIVVSDDGPGISRRTAAQHLSAARLDQIDHLGPGALRGAIHRRAERRDGDGRQRSRRRRSVHHGI